ncbi:MAG TPA: hypothetical protein VGQ20_00030 [Acidimicrobiales bacterium]|nr:hypothetical protein [Acidimicrobiales bacterium]
MPASPGAVAPDCPGVAPDWPGVAPDCPGAEPEAPEGTPPPSAPLVSTGTLSALAAEGTETPTVESASETSVCTGAGSVPPAAPALPPPSTSVEIARPAIARRRRRELFGIGCADWIAALIAVTTAGLLASSEAAGGWFAA